MNMYSGTRGVHVHPVHPGWIRPCIGPIEAKFHMEAPRNGGMIVYSNGPGHMTKMASMPIYGKNLKISSPEPKGQ